VGAVGLGTHTLLKFPDASAVRESSGAEVPSGYWKKRVTAPPRVNPLPDCVKTVTPREPVVGEIVTRGLTVIGAAHMLALQVQSAPEHVPSRAPVEAP